MSILYNNYVCLDKCYRICVYKYIYIYDVGSDKQYLWFINTYWTANDINDLKHYQHNIINK